MSERAPKAGGSEERADSSSLLVWNGLVTRLRRHGADDREAPPATGRIAHARGVALEREAETAKTSA